jgi:hypothetical protein
MALAQSGDWQQFVQLWEQLTGRQAALGRALLTDVEQHIGRGQLAGVDGLCEALLKAWVAARRQVGVRKQQERAQAVVGAVKAAKQQQGVAGRGLRERGGSSKG